MRQWLAQANWCHVCILLYFLSPTRFHNCLQSNSNNVTTISQLIFTPANSSYIPIWQAAANPIWFNKSYISKPSVIITPTNETQIQTVL
ncbi:putative FAD-binding, type PCMH, subdomain 1 [Helianthus anomalus]